jgi:hypothetical protein
MVGKYPVNGNWLAAFLRAQYTGDLSLLADYLRLGGEIGAGEIKTLSICLIDTGLRGNAARGRQCFKDLWNSGSRLPLAKFANCNTRPKSAARNCLARMR